MRLPGRDVTRPRNLLFPSEPLVKRPVFPAHRAVVVFGFGPQSVLPSAGASAFH